MIKNLAALVFSGLVLASPVSSEERQKLETDNRKPHKIVREYLDDRGVAKEEFRVNHFFYRDPDGGVHYNRKYNFEGKEFVEQYDLSDELRFKQEGTFRYLFAYPSAFFLDGIWYHDPHRDGFNGNEMVLEDETVKEQELKLKRKVKCGTRKEALCI